jgi:hypothetical protein
MIIQRHRMQTAPNYERTQKAIFYHFFPAFPEFSEKMSDEMVPQWLDIRQDYINTVTL